MRHLIVAAGWQDVAVPPGGWSGTEVGIGPAGVGELVLGYLPGAPAPGGEVTVAINETRSMRAVLSGAIYNRRELRASLAGRHAFSGRDDAEVIVHLYEERGVQGLKTLRGAFAYALWDARRHRLILARDQLGIVPLFYTTERGRLAASTTMAPLTALPGVGTGWDASALDAFLVLGTVPPPATLHPAIRQLQPGELILWEDDKLRPQRYWQLSFPERRVSGPSIGPMLREQLRDALRLRQAGAACGMLLSAGVDASALLALTGLEHRPPTRAVTAAPPDVAHDEGRTAARLAARAGVEHVVVADPVDWIATVDALLDAQAGPHASLSAAALARAASAAAGVDVLLAGTGGDEIFGGSEPVRVAERIRQFRRLPGTVREAAEMIGRIFPGRRAGRLDRLVHEQRYAPLELYGRRVSVFLPDERDELYTAEANAALGDSQPWAVLSALFAEAVSAGANDTADLLHFVEIGLRLPARVAAATAATGHVELILPFADHRIAQLVASVAPADRCGARDRQRPLRAAMEGLVPAQALARPHVAPIPGRAAWNAGPLRDLVEETLAPERLASHGVFNAEAVTRLRTEHASGRYDHAPRLWAILLAARWMSRTARSIAPPLPSAADGSPDTRLVG